MLKKLFNKILLGVEFLLCNMIELRDIFIHKTSIYDNFLVYMAILVHLFIFQSFDLIFIRKLDELETYACSKLRGK